VTTRRLAVLLTLGLGLRLVALPLPGTGDVVIWKTWSVNAVASGETTMYGVGGRPPERRAFESVAGGQRFDVDYPPLSVWAVGLAGRLYRALAPDMRDSAVFTACVKLPPLLAEIGLAWLVFASVRRLAGVERATVAAAACWLNPALILNGAVLGYLDPLILLPAVAAVVAAAAGHTWLTGALLAVAALTKPQALLVAPALALGVAALTWEHPGRIVERLALRLGETAAGGALVAVAACAPFAAAGTLPNLLAALRSVADRDNLSGNAANLWWIVTWLLRSLDTLPDVGAWQAFTTPPRLLAVSVVRDVLGYPDARAAGLVLLGAVWLWALWRARRVRDLWLIAGLGAFMVHAYFVLAANVHENYLLLAIPLAVLAAAGRRPWAAVAVALTAIHVLNLNLFYGFGERLRPNLAIPRSSTVVDAVVVLSVVNLAVLAWHARTLHAAVRLSAGRGPAER
jgi:hypothetical protein